MIFQNPQIPKDANVVVINSPKEDYSEKDVETLKSYVDNGGKFYILTDEDNYSMPNFLNLLSHYGFSVDGSIITQNDSSIVDISVNKNHSAFSSSSASDIKMTGVSKITTEGDTYKYDTLLSYNETVGEGDDAKTNSYPIAVSASKDGEKRIVLFTGAKTFNSNDTGIEDEALQRASTILNGTISWLFEAFSSELPDVTPKAFQKMPYDTVVADVIKSVIIFDVVIPAAVLFSAVMYILSRNLRSKRGKENNLEIY